MPSRRRAFIAPLALLLGLALVSLGGCTYDEGGPPDAHFEDFAAKPPKRDTVTVCPATSEPLAGNVPLHFTTWTVTPPRMPLAKPSGSSNELCGT